MQQQQILGSFVYYLEGVSYGNLFISALGPTQALILWGGLPHLRQNLEVCLLNSNSSRVFDLQMGDNLQLEMNNWCKIIFKHSLLVVYNLLKFLGLLGIMYEIDDWTYSTITAYCRLSMKLVQSNNKSWKQVLGNLNSSARLMTLRVKGGIVGWIVSCLFAKFFGHPFNVIQFKRLSSLKAFFDLFSQSL